MGIIMNGSNQKKGSKTWPVSTQKGKHRSNGLCAIFSQMINLCGKVVSKCKCIENEGGKKIKPKKNKIQSRAKVYIYIKVIFKV